jgi:CSLREA domain-containing protein
MNVQLAHAHIAAALLMCAAAAPASAATIGVNTTLDLVAVDGFCSLREAITAVNTQTISGNQTGECAAGDGSNDTIVLPAGQFVLSILGSSEDLNASGDLDVRASVTIQGAGSSVTSIDASGLGANYDRVIDIPLNGINVLLSGLAILNGHTPTVGNCSEPGGGMRVSSSTVRLIDARVDSNQTGTAFDPFGCLSLAPAGGGIYASGGALTLSNVEVTNNVSRNGGGLYASGAILGIARSRIDTNSAGTGGGGGIFDTNSVLSIGQSSVTRNSAGSFGGGIFANSPGSINISNSTIAANSASAGSVQGGPGSGMYVQYGSAVLDFVTVSANTDGGVGTYTFAGGSSSITLRNSIVSANGGTDCTFFGGATFVSGGFNLAGNGCPTNGTGDIATANPLLGPLTNDGSLPEMMLPHPDSPATNAGECAASSVFDDQRNHPRPAEVPRLAFQYDGCDIGAAELDDDIFWNGFD